MKHTFACPVSTCSYTGSQEQVELHQVSCGPLPELDSTHRAHGEDGRQEPAGIQTEPTMDDGYEELWGEDTKPELEFYRDKGVF